MPTIVRRLPFTEREESFQIANAKFDFLPNQLVVFISIIEPELEYASTVLYFPALLDTGMNDNLVVNPFQLESLLGYRLNPKDSIGDAPVRGKSLKGPGQESAPLPKRFDHTLYLHRNVKGERAPRLDVAPLQVEVDRGIIVTPSEWGYPPVPVFGMRAIRRAGLRLRIDAKQGLTVWSPREA